jgi:hypothetical protein
MRMPRAAALSGLVLLALGGTASAQAVIDCPKQVGAAVDCWSGHDPNGAFYWIAKPKQWNGVLIVHSHGGPRLAPAWPNSSIKDLARFSVFVRAGYAMVGTSYRGPGWGVRRAVADTENARRIFVDRIAKPRLTIAHGQSWGGNVAAKLNETIAATPEGKRIYDGVLITSGVLGGATHGYDYRADLRAVYQYYCRNHPRADETQYPLWMGLPKDSTLTRKELTARVDACTGIKTPEAQRTPAQRRNLANILNVLHIPERTLVSHLSWATFMFRDLTQRWLGDRNPFTNAAVRYAGSDDDAGLNRGVARFTADPAAVAQLADDSDLSGAIRVPEITMHAINDPTAFVELESRYRNAVDGARRGELLVQTFVDEREHSYLTDADYLAVLAALVDWIDHGRKPTPAGIAERCPALQKDIAGRCSFVPEFRPKPYLSRVYDRGVEE